MISLDPGGFLDFKNTGVFMKEKDFDLLTQKYKGAVNYSKWKAFYNELHEMAVKDGLPKKDGPYYVINSNTREYFMQPIRN